MSRQAYQPEGIPTTTNEQRTGISEEQLLVGPGEEVRCPTSAPGKRQGGRKSRRGVLRKWLVGTAALVGAGAMFQANTGAAHADGVEGPTSFQSNDPRKSPLITAVYPPATNNVDESTAILCSGNSALNASTYDVTNPYPYPATFAGIAVTATTHDGYGVYASAGSTNPAVYGTNSNGIGVEGVGVTGVQANGSSLGVYATSVAGTGVNASSTNGVGLIASSSNGEAAIYAVGEAGIGIHAVGANAAASSSPGRAAVFAQGGQFSYGVYATNIDGSAVVGIARGYGEAVVGESVGGIGVLAVSNTGPALVVNGIMKVLGSPVGQATLPAGSSSVTVNSPAATSNSNVLLTPLGNPNGSLWVTRANGSFTINASVTQRSNLSLAYLIIN